MNKAITPAKRREVVGLLLEIGSTSDLILCATFGCLTGLDDKLCQAIFFTMDAFPARRELLRRTTAAIGCGKAETQFVEQIIKAAESVNEQRKKVAHTLMTSSATNPGSVLVIHMKQTENWKYSVTGRDLETWTKVANAALDRCLAAYQGLCKLRGIQPRLRHT